MDIEQRPDQPPGLSRLHRRVICLIWTGKLGAHAHGAQAPQPTAAGEIQQQRFRLIFHGVGDCDQGNLVATGHVKGNPPEEGVASMPGAGLQTIR